MGPAQAPVNSELACTGLVLVPANLATLGTPLNAQIATVAGEIA